MLHDELTQGIVQEKRDYMQIISITGRIMLIIGVIFLAYVIYDGKRKGIKKDKAELILLQDSGYADSYTASENKGNIYRQELTEKVKIEKPKTISDSARAILEEIEKETKRDTTHKAYDKDSTEILRNDKDAGTNATDILYEDTDKTSKIEINNMGASEMTEIMREKGTEVLKDNDNTEILKNETIKKGASEMERTEMLSDIEEPFVWSDGVITDRAKIHVSDPKILDEIEDAEILTSDPFDDDDDDDESVTAILTDDDEWADTVVLDDVIE